MRLEGSAASAIQRRRRRQVSETTGRRATGTASPLRAASRRSAQSAVKTADTAYTTVHTCDCCESVSRGSSSVGYASSPGNFLRGRGVEEVGIRMLRRHFRRTSVAEPGSRYTRRTGRPTLRTSNPSSRARVGVRGRRAVPHRDRKQRERDEQQTEWTNDCRRTDSMRIDRCATA